MAWQTLFGREPQGFFIPYRYAASVEPVASASMQALFADRNNTFQNRLDHIASLADELSGLDGPPPLPRFDQDWFTGLDACAAYSIVAERQPNKIIEIGSGHSTRFLAHAVQQKSPGTSITCVDPAPRRDISNLPVTHKPALISLAERDLLEDFAPNDLLFIDSSHIAMPGTDVDMIFNEFLPTLPEGALVHVHDIFLPAPYPETWSWRGYSEQMLVAALLNTASWDVVFSSYYVRANPSAFQLPELTKQLKTPAQALETSLWMIKTG